MNLDQPFNFDGWFDPPVIKEVTAAESWHEAGQHEDIRHWAAQGCMNCRDEADALTIQAEFRFTPADLADAMAWEKAKGYDYTRRGDIRNLLLDWLANDAFRGTHEDVI